MVSVFIGTSKLSYMDKKWYLSSTKKDNLKCIKESLPETNNDLLICVKVMSRCDSFNASDTQLHHMLMIGLKNAVCRFNCEVEKTDILKFSLVNEGKTYISKKLNNNVFLDIQDRGFSENSIVFNDCDSHDQAFKAILQLEVGEYISEINSPDVHDLIDAINKISKKLCSATNG